MILENQKIKITIWSHNIKYFRDNNYKVNMGDSIEIDVLNLPKDSTREILVLCDYCLENIVKKRYKNFIYNKENNIKDCCSNCKNKKGRETLMREYGVSSPMHLEEVKNKQKNTCLKNHGVENISQSVDTKNRKKSNMLEKYGVEYFFQTEEFKIKSQITNNEKYGVDHHTQSEIYKENYKNSILEKYGVENPAQSEIVQQKYQNTCMERYGVKSFFQSDTFKEKSHNSMYQNGTSPSSKQQRHINLLLNGELNFPFKGSILDIAFPKEMLCIEYDGSGHSLGVKLGYSSEEEFMKKEFDRTNKILKNKWKIIRIISRNDLLPSDEKIIELIQFCKNYLKRDHSLIEIDIDDSKIKCSEFEENINLGKLKTLI